MIGIEEGSFPAELPRHVRRMLPMRQERFLRTYVPRRAYRFRVDCGALYWSIGAVSDRIDWCKETGVQGWFHRHVDTGPRERRGRSMFLFDREVDAVAFVMRWA